MLFEIGALKNFANIAGKHLCWSLCLIKFAKFLRTIFFTEHFWCLFLKALKFSFSTIKGLSLKSYVSGGKRYERHNKSSVR